MSSSSDQVRLEERSKRLAALLQDYQALSIDITNEVDAVRRTRNLRKLEEFDKEIETLKASIDELDQKKSILNWEKNLPEIDFRKARTVFLQVQEQLGSEAGAALFLLQKSNVMGGEWCLQHIRNLLSRKTRDFLPLRVQFLSHEALNEAALLSRLGECLGLKSQPADLQQHVQILIEKINSSLHMGRIILFELVVSASVPPDDHFLPWLLQDFWCPLVRKVAEFGTKSHARFVVIMLADSTIPMQLIAQFCCTGDQFCREKILELPLESWEEAEIRDWLILFSGLNTCLNENQITTMAKNIYLASNAGQPSSVYTQLMRQLSRISPL